MHALSRIIVQLAIKSLNIFSTVALSRIRLNLRRVDLLLIYVFPGIAFSSLRISSL